MVYSKENDELMHYGILGMKWGRRKNTSAESKTASMTTLQKKQQRINRLRTAAKVINTTLAVAITVNSLMNTTQVMDGSAVKFGRSRQDAAEMLANKFGNNASGVVSVQWKKSSPLKGGHIFNWEIKDGVVKFFDGQNNRDDSKVSGYWNFINANDSLTIARLDNAEINFDAIKKYVTNR